MTIYTTFGPDPIWVMLLIGGVVLLVAGKWGRARLGPVASRRLVGIGALLLTGLVVYSLLMTWFAPPIGGTK